jgi:hypothetical protein
MKINDVIKEADYTKSWQQSLSPASRQQWQRPYSQVNYNPRTPPPRADQIISAAGRRLAGPAQQQAAQPAARPNYGSNQQSVTPTPTWSQSASQQQAAQPAARPNYGSNQQSVTPTPTWSPSASQQQAAQQQAAQQQPAASTFKNTKTGGVGGALGAFISGVDPNAERALTQAARDKRIFPNIDTTVANTAANTAANTTSTAANEPMYQRVAEAYQQFKEDHQQ